MSGPNRVVRPRAAGQIVFYWPCFGAALAASLGAQTRGILLPTKKCHVCARATPMGEFEICCKNCTGKELDVLIGVFWFIHCYGSDYCPIRSIYQDIQPVGGLSVVPDLMRSWINRGYLEMNEMKCIRVPPAMSTYLDENGFNQGPILDKTLETVEAKHRQKKVGGGPALVQTDEKRPKVERMVYQARD